MSKASSAHIDQAEQYESYPNGWIQGAEGPNAGKGQEPETELSTAGHSETDDAAGNRATGLIAVSSGMHQNSCPHPRDKRHRDATDGSRACRPRWR
jgi:hypothetical protein